MAKLLHYGSRGARVKRLQHALNDSPYFKPRRKLVVDGEMGPLTCAAVQLAKYRLGYPAGKIDPDVDDQVAGDFLLGLLERSRELPDQYAKRRRSRMRKLRTAWRRRRLRRKALKVIKGELGTLEAGGHSNVIRYTAWWGWGPCAYCVIGISWAWTKVGSTAFRKGSRWANTDAMLADAKAGRNGIHLTSDPAPGCPGVIDFNGHSDPDHAITFVRDNGDGTCETIEFNTTGANGMEGVWRKDRPLKNCWWFGVEH